MPILFRKIHQRIDTLSLVFDGLLRRSDLAHADLETIKARQLEMSRVLCFIKAEISSLNISAITGKLNTMDARIQRAIDAITRLDDLDDALKADVQAKATEISSLKSQLDDLQQSLNNGEVISKDDLAALAQTVDNIDQLNQATPTAVPANTDAGTDNSGSASGQNGQNDTSGGSSGAGDNGSTGTSDTGSATDAGSGSAGTTDQSQS